MSFGLAGAMLGLAAALGLLLLAAAVLAARRPSLASRVLPYVRDRPGATTRTGRVDPAAGGPLVGWVLRSAATGLERLLGGAPVIRRRLDRAGLDLDVVDFRVQQVRWGLAGLGCAAAFGIVRSWTSAAAPLPLLLLCVGGFVSGFLLRDQRLGAQVRRREQDMLAELPTLAELLALSVAAGEGPVAALDRVVRRSAGELSRELAGVLARIRTGESVTDAFDRLAATTGLGVVARFAHGIAVAVERGTPLADVLHAQAGDVRDAGRRALVEKAARKEIAMMVPVVFLVLPTTVLFAFWPGFVGLSLS